MPTNHHQDPCKDKWPKPGEPPAHRTDPVTWQHSHGQPVTISANPANEFPFEQPDEPHVVQPNQPFNCRIKNLPPGEYIYDVDPCPPGPRSPKTVIIS